MKLDIIPEINHYYLNIIAVVLSVQYYLKVMSGHKRFYLFEHSYDSQVDIWTEASLYCLLLGKIICFAKKQPIFEMCE